MSQNETAKPRRSTANYLKIILLLSLIGAGVIYYWLNSPTYAVMQLEKSIQEKDLATFYSRLDINRIYDSSIDALTVIKTEGTPDSPWENVQNNIGAGFTKVLKSQVMNTVKHEIELGFRKGGDDTTVDNHTPVLPIKEFFSDAQTFVFANPVRSGDRALVNVELHLKKMGKTYPLTLVLEKVGDWKVTGFEGLSSTLTLFVKDQALKVEDHNRNASSEMTRLLPFFGQVRQEDNMLGLGKQVHFEFLFQNRGPSLLKRIDGTLVILNSKNEEILKEPFNKTDLNLALQEKKVFLIAKDIGIFTYKAVTTDVLTLQFKYEHAHFEDGKDLRIVKAYNEL